jgi:hypothetical protein
VVTVTPPCVFPAHKYFVKVTHPTCKDIHRGLNWNGGGKGGKVIYVSTLTRAKNNFNIGILVYVCLIFNNNNKNSNACARSPFYNSYRIQKLKKITALIRNPTAVFVLKGKSSFYLLIYFLLFFFHLGFGADHDANLLR